MPRRAPVHQASASPGGNTPGDADPSQRPAPPTDNTTPSRRRRAALSGDNAPSRRTVWHAFFAALLLERRSPDFDVLVEVPLSSEPQRVDVLLVRKRRPNTPPAAGKVLRGLWPRLGSDSLVEFKSAARPLRRGDLIRLLGYGAQYHARHVARLTRGEPALVLVVPRLSPTLHGELGRLGFRLGAGEGGYWPIEGGPYRGWVVSLEQVGRAERDEVLKPFVHAKLALPEDNQSLRWWRQRVSGPSGDDMADLSKLEGYEEMMTQLFERLPPDQLGRLLAKMPAKTRAYAAEWLLAKMPAETLATLLAEKFAALPAEKLSALPAEKRLAGLSARERLAGLSADELEALRAELSAPKEAKKPKRGGGKARR